MDSIHRVVGYAVPAAFALLAVWAIAAFIRNKPPREAFWRLVAGVQVIIGVQIAVGAILFVAGARPPAEVQWLHYAYGGLFPAALLVVAHRVGRRMEDIAWVAFGAAAVVNFGLTLRALQTGLGPG